MKKVLLCCISLLLFANFMQAQPYYYTPDVTNFIATYGCNGCHGGTSGFFITTYAGILAGGNDCGNTVVPFNADDSPIVWQIDPTVENCPGKPDMPFGGPIVSPEDVALIREWINTGALENAASACADLSFSAYLEGSSFNKCLEIYNGTGTDIDLSTYTISVYHNGNIIPNETVSLAGILSADGYYLICHTDFALPGLTPNQLTNELLFNGNDAVVLNNGIGNVDVIGQIGFDPGEGWTNGDCSTENMSLVKIDNGTNCQYSTFSGTTDFAPVIGAFYTCFPEDDPSGFYTYVPVVECPEIPAPIVADAEFCVGDALPIITATVFDENLTVNWYNELGDLVNTGLSFEVAEAGNYTVIAIDLDGCESETAFFTVTENFAPYVLGNSITCTADGLFYDILFVCGVPSDTDLTFASLGGFTVIEVDAVTFLILNVPSGVTDVVELTDENGCSTNFEYTNTCPPPVECPQLTAAVDTDILICPNTGEIFTLKVNVSDALEDQIQWSTGEIGIAIDVFNLVSNDCDGTVFSYTAFIPASDDCPETSVTFNILVLPDVSLGAELVYSELSCYVSLQGYCDQFLVEYSVNGAENVPGNFYWFDIFETGSVTFTLYDPTDLCPNESYTYSVPLICLELPYPNLGGAIWGDTTADGLYDELTETGIEGIFVILYNADTEEIVSTTYTNEYGYYYFEFFPPGNYFILIDLATLPPGFETLGGVDEFGQSAIITLGDGESFSINVPLQQTVTDPCDLQEPIVINTQEINDCADGTYMVRVMISGGNTSVDYGVAVNDVFFYSVAANTVLELGPFELGTGYSILVTDGIGCVEGITGFALCTVPVSLLSFTGSAAPDGNQLRWTTASEVNNHYFILQHSMNGYQFTNIAQIIGAGNSSTPNTYSHLDANAPEGLSYYRLIQTDFDGNSQIAGQLTLNRNALSFEVKDILPVPVRNTLEVRLTTVTPVPMDAQLFDVSGRLLRVEHYQTQAGMNTIQINVSELPAGVYFLRLQTNEAQQTLKVVKQ